jgi:heme oxygenase
MTVVETELAAQPLSVVVREGSRAAHEQAEGTSFMTELLEGRLSERAYADYLTGLRPVYAALEQVGADLAGDPLVAAVRDEALERLAAIDADLDHWSRHATPGLRSAATAAYAERIEQARAWGGLYVAHHYTRYLGDLSGGLAIGRIVGRTYGVGPEALGFYAFPGIEKPKPYKDGYRARLDALPLDAEQKARVLAEVRAGFALNTAFFAELAGRLDEYRA